MKVELKNVSKKYESNVEYTLKNLNLLIDDKDFLVLLGPSGCGKTTLLRMIAGLNSITSGDLLFNDRRVNELSPRDRGIAMIFQSYALYPHMNVYKNIALGLSIAKEKKTIIDQRVKDVAKILKIYDYLYKKPSDLSGGQRQRVALGRAIARKPKIFLMDEPLSNLDAKLREKMRTELVKIHNMMNTTTIYVTHDQLEAMTMATKIVLMNNQQIVQIGKPSELFEKPNSIFAAKFIGTPSMNIIEGEIRGNKFYSKNGKIVANPSKKHLALFKQFNIKKVALGIRCNDLQISAKKLNKMDCLFQGNLLVSENLGLEYQMTFGISNDLDITALSRIGLTQGQRYFIGIENEQFHFFDLDSQQRVTKNFLELKQKWNTHQEFLKKSKLLNTNKKRNIFQKIFRKKDKKEK